MKPEAVCLLSGGLDSTTALYAASKEGFAVTALTLHYGQLHFREIDFAKTTARELKLRHHIVSFPLPWKGSALLDSSITMPVNREEVSMSQDIPSTYVPARNSVFLSLAASCAEAIHASAIFIGANILDYSGYPDCRPEYFEAFEKMLALGTKVGAEGGKLKIHAPLLQLNKKEIIQLGQKLGVPFDKTWSCYRGQSKPCGECDSCRLRAKGFLEAGLKDPLIEHAVSA